MSNTQITSSLVDECGRLFFLPKYFGNLFLVGENMVYQFADKLSVDYKNGLCALWNFYELSNGGFYMAPAYDGAMNIAVDSNYFEGEVSSDAAGIVITLFAVNTIVNSLHEKHDVDDLIDRYYFLRDYACEHPESSLILQAID